MDLPTVWFVLVAILWIGYLALEGFDFGVGMLTRTLARDDSERRTLITTIGPVWDGNEVWVVAAVGATFAAFPHWYATAWSAYYLPLVLVLFALIGRGLALEYRAKGDTDAWRRRWDLVIFAGSAVPAFSWGVLLAGFARGLPLDESHDFAGGVADLVTPYGILGGAVTVALSLLHGAHYVALKTVGDIRTRARALATPLAVLAAVLVAVFTGWTAAEHAEAGASTWSTGTFAAGTVLAIVGGAMSNARGREGWAFAWTFAGIVALGAVLFGSLYPDVLPSTLEAADGLTVGNASSSDYTLAVMAWVAVPFVPIIVAYQSWVYWTFRARVGVDQLT